VKREFCGNKTEQQKEKGKEMKINRISTMARLTGISIALALLTGFSGQVNAQNGAKGGATKLLEPNGRSFTRKVETSDYKPMSCSKCKDEVIQVRNTDSKGGARGLLTGVPLTKAVARHGCNACSVDWTVTGHGRARVSIATHKCTSCGA
jgi:hypothetical protein